MVMAGSLLPFLAQAEVTRVEIQSRKVVQDSIMMSKYGPYEVIKGIIYFEVDPDNPANLQIVDLKLAPRNSRGRVEFSAEFELHKPAGEGAGNQRLLYGVNNRGNKMAAGFFNFLAGSNWLYQEGWSYVWCGWNCDVPESDRKLNIKVPVATNNGKTITGKIYSEMISYADDIMYNRPVVWGGSLAYAPEPSKIKRARLTMRQYRWQKPIKIPRKQWMFGRFRNGKVEPDHNYIYLKPGFKPGWLYDLVYTGKGPKVTGLGLAAIRDLVSFLKYGKKDKRNAANPLEGRIKFAFAYGHSQSGRLLNHFVYQNFNGDEQGRKVFDGIYSNCPGAGKGLFNSRFAQPTRHGSHHEDNWYPIDFFPFATVKQRDPVTGQTGDAFAKAKQAGFFPKMIYVNSSTDYWTRAASLLHTDVMGKRDIKIDPDVRMYAMAGIAHTSGRTAFIGRALLTALDRWVTHGIKPPDSQIPKISDGTLVDYKTWRRQFPVIPGIVFPVSFYQPYRLDLGKEWETRGIATHVPPKIGPKYVCLIPAVDEDGNELAGIRLPDVGAPLYTVCGWSQRNLSFSHTIRRNAGRVWPFPRTKEEREKSGDPRKSILERYPSKMHYIREVMKSLFELRGKGLLLDRDFVLLLHEAVSQNYWPTDAQSATVFIKEAKAEPATLKTGETLKLAVCFQGRRNHIFAVQAIILDSARQRLGQLPLNDSGSNGDKKAGDDIWTIDIPVNQAGIYYLDIEAIDKDFNPVYLAGTIKEGKGKTGSVKVTINQ